MPIALSNGTGFFAEAGFEVKEASNARPAPDRGQDVAAARL